MKGPVPVAAIARAAIVMATSPNDPSQRRSLCDQSAKRIARMPERVEQRGQPSRMPVQLPWSCAPGCGTRGHPRAPSRHTPALKGSERRDSPWSATSSGNDVVVADMRRQIAKQRTPERHGGPACDRKNAEPALPLAKLSAR